LAGYHYFEVLSDGFCKSEIEIEIPEITNPLIFQANILPVVCGINTIQSVEIEIAQGTTPYYINGNAVSTNPVVFNNLGVGYIYFEISDANNCALEYGTFIDSIYTLKAKATHTPIKCAGTPSIVTVSAIGGSYPFTGIGNFSVSGGNYNYLVVDDNGCRDSVLLNIFEPQPLVITLNTVNINCSADSGIVKIFASGGVKPFKASVGNNTFSFSDSLILNMETGNYNLNILDANNCFHFKSFTLYPAAQLSLNANVVNVSCHGVSSGYIDIDFISGNLPANINGVWYADWSVRLDSLPIGMYPIEIIDTAGCVYYNEIEVFQPTKLKASVSFASLRCVGDSTLVSFVATGGTPPYDAPQAEYYWGGESVTSSVIDENGCVVQIDTIIKDAKALEFEYDIYAPKCVGQQGSLFIEITDGNTPAKIFNKQFIDTVSVLLQPGTQSVVIYDKNTCAFEFEVEVPAAVPFVVNATAQNLKCFEDASGSVLLQISGGTQPYYFNNAPISSPFNIQNVSAGNFIALIRDDENCDLSISTNLTQPNKLLVEAVTTQTATCHDRNDAYAEVKVIGGTPPYSYRFDGSVFQAQNSMQSLSTGAHNYEVKDANNCALNSGFTIKEFVKTTHVISIDSVRCFGRNGGSFKVYSTDSSRAPYFYALDGNEAQPYNVFYNLVSGEYNVIALDKNQCADSLKATVFQPKEIDSSVFINGILLPVDSFEIYERNYINFTKQNSLPWSFESFPDNFLIISNDTLRKTKPNRPFSYTIKVFSDTLGSTCFVEYKGFVHVIEVAKLPNVITPDGDGLNDFWEVDLDVYPNPSVVIFDRWGRIVFETENYANNWNGVNQMDGKSLDDGAYFYVLKSSVKNVEVKDYINILNSKK